MYVCMQWRIHTFGQGATSCGGWSTSCGGARHLFRRLNNLICFDNMFGGGPRQGIIILNRIYNCTKHGDLPMDNATTAHFTLHILILQLHKIIVINCTLKYSLGQGLQRNCKGDMTCFPRFSLWILHCILNTVCCGFRCLSFIHSFIHPHLPLR